MRQYEVMVMLSPTVDERNVEQKLSRYTSVVTDDGGSVETLDVWGRRRLAYEIDNHAEAVYVVLEVRAEPATVSELDRQLGLNEDVLRTKVVRPTARPAAR